MPDDASVEVADRLHSAAIHLLRAVAKEDARSGLSAPRLSALSVVVFAGPLMLGRLAEAERVKPPTMTRTVDALEAAGLVRRLPGDDRRSVVVEATAKGRTTLAAARARRIERLAAALDELTAAERSVLAEAAPLLERASAAAGGG